MIRKQSPPCIRDYKGQGNTKHTIAELNRGVESRVFLKPHHPAKIYKPHAFKTAQR
jgi:hypothetical protein